MFGLGAWKLHARRLFPRGANPLNCQMSKLSLVCASRRGQAMLESLFVLIILVAAFCFFFDFIYGIVTREVLNYGANKMARAETVGFNSFQNNKALRIGLIPISGNRIYPEGRTFEDLRSYARIYLQTENWPDARGMLHYDRWDSLSAETTRTKDLLKTEVSMAFPTLMPERLAAFMNAGEACPWDASVRRKAIWEMEDHASFYLAPGNAKDPLSGGL